MANGTKISDNDLYDLSVKKVYDIKDKRPDHKLEIKTGDKTNTYTVVSVQHDAQTGFDAMAVKDDKGNIVIVYGGTAGASDVVTDAQIAGTYLGATPSPAQFEQAKAFRNRVVKDNPGADITLTGHSLGGGMSNAV